MVTSNKSSELPTAECVKPMSPMSSPLFLAFCVWLVAVGCTACDASSSAIAHQFDESKGSSVDLAVSVPGNWEKVCVFGPYSNNETIKKTLGFEWGTEAKTSIQTDEGISLLLFVRENRAITYIEHPRNHGDFSNLTAQCFPRKNAA
jgi:hypothetical protein